MSEEYKSQFEDNDISSSSSETEQEIDLNSFSSAQTTKEANKKRNKKKGKQIVLKVLLTVFLVGVITVSIVVGAFALYIPTIDITMEVDLNNLTAANSSSNSALKFTTTIYVDDGTGKYNEYQRLYDSEDRIWIAYDEEKAKAKDPEYTGIPQRLADAFVAIEDKRFNDHTGTDWRRTIGAFISMLNPASDESYGGSTITQQLVKNLTDDNDRNVTRKIREILRARYLEENYSKPVILECYLNTIALGHGKCGVEAAANFYFDKSVKDLTLAECATIAAITRRPTYYAPDVNPEENKRRRNSVLYQMLDQGYITQAEYDEAIAEEINVVASNKSAEVQINSYFVDALIDQVVDDLCKEYNYDQKAAGILFYNAGYKIYTTLDPKIQTILETVYADSATYGLKAADGATMQGAMTVMDYEGNVRGLVGGIGEKTANRGLNRATDAKRQPGSTIKPISAYGPALEQNLINYSTKLNDTATNYKGWKPVNWYGSYWGSVTVEYALERSINTIPVYLVNKMTPQVSFDFLTQKLGISTLTKNDVDLSPMGMGGTNGGITTLESAAAYAIFGNNGLYYEPRLYTKVLDQNGNVVLSYDDNSPTLALTEDTATIMNHLLQNVVYGSNGTAKGAGSFVPQMKLFAKTGTTNSQNDLWFVGGSPYYVASTWCGYDTQQPISQNTIAQKMWGAVMSKIHDKLPEKEFVDSTYVVQRFFCKETGSLATKSCPSRSVGWYKKSNLPEACKTHTGTALGDPETVLKQEAENAKKEEEKDKDKDKDKTSKPSTSSDNSSSDNSSSGNNSSSESSGDTSTNGQSDTSD